MTESEAEQGHVGLLAAEAFLCSHFMFVGSRLQPWPALNSKGYSGTVANQGWEGMQRQGGLHLRSDLKKPEKYLRTHEAMLKECRPCAHFDPYQQLCRLTTARKLLTKSPCFWGISPLSPLCLTKQTKQLSCSLLPHPKLCLWDSIWHPYTEAWGEGGGRGVKDRGDTCIFVTSSCWCMAKTITIL